MAGNTYGQLFTLTTAGESHGPGYLGIVDGCPPGLALSEADLQPDLDRRRPGQSKITTQRKEGDEVEIISGVFEGKTTGTPIGLLLRNKDQRSKDYSKIKDKYRPGHADYTFDAKFGFRDYRGGGRSSARESTMRVAAAAIAKKLLRQRHGIEIVGYVKQVGDVVADIPHPENVTLDQVEANPVRCPDPDQAQRMIQTIEAVRKDQDSIGGVSELVATGVPAGWGEPVFDKLKADLGKALFSLPAVLGVEYGIGFGCAGMRGSENNDVFVGRRHGGGGDRHEGTQARRHEGGGDRHEATPLAAFSQGGRDEGGGDLGRPASAGPGGEPEGGIATRSNRHGGMLGGISSGMPLVLRAAVKPTSSLSQPQPTVTRSGEPTTISTGGRHDPCLLPRFVPMGEAMVALTLADHMLRQAAMHAPEHRAEASEPKV